MYDFFLWIEQTSLAIWVTTSRFAFPLFEAVHVIGIALVFGTIAIVDLRLLGIPSTRRPFTEIAADSLKWTWLGFAVAVVTGLFLFVSRATFYYESTPFRLKMLFLAFAGINMIIFEVFVARTAHRWDKDLPVPAAGKIAGTLSLLFWLSVIVFGRWIGFVEPEDPFAGLI